MNLTNPNKISLLLVDDEPKVINGLERNLSMMEDDWDIHLAYSGTEGLATLRENPIDVVVSDLRMPEMDGSVFLAKTMAEFPASLRFILSGFADQDLMIKATGVAHRYLTKPCNSRDLVIAIRQVFATQSLIRNREVANLVNNTTELHANSGPLQELLTATDDPESDIATLTTLIKRHPTIHASVLHVANTAFFGSGGSTETVEEALQMLGVEFMRSLAIMELTKSSLNLPPALEEVADAVLQHCVETSQIAFKLKSIAGNPKLIQSLASLALLHDLGKLIFLANHKNEYEKLWAKSADQNIPLWKLERETYGCDHGAAGAYLFNLWGLPEIIVRGVAWHHLPLYVTTNSVCPTSLLHLANYATHLSGGKKRYCGGDLEPKLLKRFQLAPTFADELN